MVELFYMHKAPSVMENLTVKIKVMKLNVVSYVI